jgi:hypothetical protein
MTFSFLGAGHPSPVHDACLGTCCRGPGPVPTQRAPARRALISQASSWMAGSAPGKSLVLAKLESAGEAFQGSPGVIGAAHSRGGARCCHGGGRDLRAGVWLKATEAEGGGTDRMCRLRPDLGGLRVIAAAPGRFRAGCAQTAPVCGGPGGQRVSSAWSSAPSRPSQPVKVLTCRPSMISSPARSSRPRSTRTVRSAWAGVPCAGSPAGCVRA